MNMRKLQKKEGTILILAIWALGLLGFLTVSLGAQIRQKMTLVSRLEQRQDLYWLAKSGVAKAMYIFYEAHKNKAGTRTPPAVRRIQWMNNPAVFKDASRGPGSFELKYRSEEESAAGRARVLYGFTDEERRININKADEDVLTKLIQTVLSMDEEDANDLAQAVIDWRKYGDSEIVGFYSDEYYDNLEFPFPEKKANFETTHELALLRGWTPEVAGQLLPYLTVFGSGKVNINTASRPVLLSLGFPDVFVSRFLAIRRGVDGMDWTADDMVFPDLPQLVSFMAAQKSIEKEDIQLIEELNAQGWLGTQSYYYRIHSYATIASSKGKKLISCVFFAPEQKIVYWKEL